MMTREERAKQFMPFDAMKGLKEALLDREEKHTRVKRHDISEEQQKKNSEVLLSLKKYELVSVNYYANFHDIKKDGRITELNLPFRYIKIDDERIAFEDIYCIAKSSPKN